MMHKHTITLNKPWANTVAAGFALHGIMNKLKNAVKIQIPTGYQDETGFHLGVKPAKSDVQWPSVW